MDGKGGEQGRQLSRRTAITGAAGLIAGSLAAPVSAQLPTRSEHRKHLGPKHSPEAGGTFAPYHPDTPWIRIDPRIKKEFQTILAEKPTTTIASSDDAPNQLTFQASDGALTVHEPGHTMTWLKMPNEEVIISRASEELGKLGVLLVSFGSQDNARLQIAIGRGLNGKLQVFERTKSK